MRTRSSAMGLTAHGWILAMFFLLMVGPSTAQNEEDGYASQTMRPQGTARSLGLGGAFGALGGDAGALWVNPGAMGLYTTTEFSLTPGIEFNDATAPFMALLGPTLTGGPFSGIWHWSSTSNPRKAPQ
ncbi:MAG: hypothetical protein IPH53_02525 [Flavobacteriales bacterium]|nr:hypothetical protein [Flavobacteriales bacterium]